MIQGFRRHQNNAFGSIVDFAQRLDEPVTRDFVFQYIIETTPVMFALQLCPRWF